MGYTPIRVGQTYPPFRIQVKTDDGGPVQDLTTATLTMYWHNVGTMAVTTGTGTFSILDGPNSRVQYICSAADVATAGVYEITMGINYGGSPSQITFTDPVPLTIVAG